MNERPVKDILFVMNQPETDGMSEAVMEAAIDTTRQYGMNTVMLHIPNWQQYGAEAGATRIEPRDDAVALIKRIADAGLLVMLHMRPLSRPDGSDVETLAEARFQMREYHRVARNLYHSSGGIAGIYLDGCEALSRDPKMGHFATIYEMGDALGSELRHWRGRLYGGCIQASQSGVGRMSDCITRLGQRDYWERHGMINPIEHCRTFDGAAIRRYGRDPDLGWFSERVLFEADDDGKIATRATTPAEWRAWAQAVIRERAYYTLQWFGPRSDAAWGVHGRGYLAMLAGRSM